jgi:hypothetical protein
MSGGADGDGKRNFLGFIQTLDRVSEGALNGLFIELKAA